MKTVLPKFVQNNDSFQKASEEMTYELLIVMMGFLSNEDYIKYFDF
jgi:hypothetical protein